MPCFEATNITALLSPAGTPDESVQRVCSGGHEALVAPATRGRFAMLVLEPSYHTGTGRRLHRGGLDAMDEGEGREYSGAIGRGVLAI